LGASFNKDRLRNASLSFNFDFSDELGGVTQLVATATQGLNVFNATDKDPNATNSLAAAQYIKIDLYISRNQQLPGNFSFFTAGEVMLSDKLLTSYNKFSYGGGQFGRGYDSGIIEGDNGLVVSFEPRWTYYINDRVGIQPFAFIDYGKVWNNKSELEETFEADGASYGAGLRFWGSVESGPFPDWNLSAYWGQILRRLDDERSNRFVVQATLFF
jgi:hemolysin activation/secretion protein